MKTEYTAGTAAFYHQILDLFYKKKWAHEEVQHLGLLSLPFMYHFGNPHDFGFESKEKKALYTEGY